MNRLTALLIVLILGMALLCAHSALGEEGPSAPYRAVVANPNVADRLNLRARPDTASDSLGRFYSGTLVTVLDTILDKEGREWARVDLSDGYEAGISVTGYMLSEYLMPMNRNYEAPQLFHTAWTASRNVPVRVRAKNSADTVGTVSGLVYVLGDIGDDWRLVGSEDHHVVGYVRTAQLTNQQIRVEDAYLIPADGGATVTVYKDKAMKKQAATYYAGATVRIVDYSRAGGWAAVQGFGLRSSLGDRPDFIGGYVRLEELRVFCFYWQQDLQGKTGVVKEDCEVESLSVPLAKGMAVTVAGEIGDKYQVIFGSAYDAVMLSGFVGKDKIDLTDRPAGLDGPGRLGYVKLSGTEPVEYAGYFACEKLALPGGENCGYTSNAVGELIAETGGFAQVRQLFGENFFASAEGAEIIWNDDLWPHATSVAAPAQWTADEETRGLWVLENLPGKSVMAEVTEGEEGWRNGVYNGGWQYWAEGEEACRYTVFIPAGAEVRLEGEGTLRPLGQDEGLLILPGYQTRVYAEDEPLFSGSGRFFCGTQIPAELNGWYNFRVEPLDGAEDWYTQITDLFHGTVQRLDGSDEGDDGLYYLDLAPGQFLELHNCVLYIFYGNG